MPAPTHGTTPTVDRRAALAALGGAALAAVVVACGSDDTGSGTSSTTSTVDGTTTTTAGSTTTSEEIEFTSSVCEVVPEIGDGPFYLDLDLVRRDITDRQDGTPFHMAIRVVDTTAGCTPLEGVAVEVWQANAEGWYSGYVGVLDPPTATPPTHEDPTDDLTFLRGTQVTGTDGIVHFDSVYPSWYLGRTNHVHVKVHLANDAVATTQLFFDPAVSDEVFSTSPYDEHTGQDTFNDTDGALRTVADPALVMWDLAPEGSGYRGTITLGVTS